MTMSEILKIGIEFEHIGVAVNDIKECLDIFGGLFELREITGIYDDAFQNVRISFVNLSGAKLELIEPLNKDRKSPVDNIIKGNMSYYHLCFSTWHFAETISKLLQKGAIEVTKPFSATAFNNRKITFLYIKHLGLIELVEKEK